MFDITISKEKTLILIDASYYVFYRFFATLKWYNIQKKEFTENEFNNSFLKHLSSDLKKITKKWKTNTDNVIFCLDCARSKIWRNEYFKEYKNGRVLNINFNQNIFNIFYNYLKEKNLNTANCDKLEADDVIYLTHKAIKNKVDNIVIITNDNDYLQLITNNTEIINMQFKNILNRTKLTTSKSILIFKALLGDKSDNIPKICTGINKENATKMANDEEMLKNWLDINDLNDKYNFNLKLISFEYIPLELQNNFKNLYNLIII
tara:strand:+ start:5393 stop:6181 length:789 start_codon:yes stop_codon:yes gene_type:complete